MAKYSFTGEQLFSLLKKSIVNYLRAHEELEDKGLVPANSSEMLEEELAAAVSDMIDQLDFERDMWKEGNVSGIVKFDQILE